MCGIVGIISFNKNQFYSPQQKVFKNLLYLDAFRGEDGTGVFGVNKHGNVTSVKTKDPSGMFVYSPEYSKFENGMMHEYNIVVGHNRKATVGAVRDETAHPFISGNVIMVHNGKMVGHRSHYQTEVDSEALCKYLEANEENLLEALSKLEGAFSVVWYNAQSQKLRFWRNTDRPMWHAAVGNYLYFSSERSILMAALIRANVSFKDDDFYEQVANQMFTIEMTKSKLGWISEIVPEAPKKEYPKSQHYWGYYGAIWQSNFEDDSCNDDSTDITPPVVSFPITKVKKTSKKTTSGNDFQETLMQLQGKVGKQLIFRLVDYVQDTKGSSDNYIEGYYSDIVSASAINVPQQFLEEVETWPHSEKYFRAKVEKIKTSAGGKTFELELNSQVELIKMFRDAENKWISYDVITDIGGEDFIFCGEENCWSNILPEDYEFMRLNYTTNVSGIVMSHQITCKDCLEVETKKGSVTALTLTKEKVVH
jgi:predicted glutamine amidotransferase